MRVSGRETAALNSEYLGRELNLRLTVNMKCLITRDYGTSMTMSVWYEASPGPLAVSQVGGRVPNKDWLVELNY